MKFTYCPHCGTKTILKEIGDEGMIPYCETCNIPLFPMFSTCVLSVVMNELHEIALIRQSYGTPRFVGVAGYMKCGETAEEAAKREVIEEIGLVPESVTFLESHWYDGKDMLMLGFLARVKKTDFCLSDEVAEAKWFPLDEAVRTVREGSIIQKLIQKAETMV
ncbi:MAG: NUDIX domain-containing protein [Ruminococcus sp.]|nr:NUDIX domain-containing protein [Ruminococcus sp.]